jgi:hypothetical protein
VYPLSELGSLLALQELPSPLIQRAPSTAGMADGPKEEVAAAATAAAEAQSSDVSVEPSGGPAKVHVLPAL